MALLAVATTISLGAAAGLLLPAAHPAASSTALPGTHAQAPPPSALRCYVAARDRTALSEAQAQSLCQGASSRGPVRCYEAAQDRTALSESRAITLCQCARSRQPVTCYERAADETDLPEPELVQMCRATVLHRVALPYCTAATLP